MFRSGIAFTDLTVNSACDELFPGVEDVDAQATLQLRAALDAFDEGVFEYHNRVAAQAGGGPPPDPGSKASGARGQRRTRREQAYASRIPEDRQFFRPVEVQSAEWAAFKPHLWLRGRQVQSPETTTHPYPHAQMHTPQPLAAAAGAASASALGGSSASVVAATATSAVAAVAAGTAMQPEGELVAQGSKLRLSPAPLGLDVAQEEVLASDGTYEETFFVQYDEWEAHVPANLRRRRGRSRDEKAVAIGLPPVEPKNAVLYDIAETLLPEMWSRLAPFLAPVLTRLAAERRDQPGGGVRGSSAFHGAGGGRLGGGGEFEIITFSSGEEEGISGDILVGGSDLALGLGRSPGVNDDEDLDGIWHDNGGSTGSGGRNEDGRFEDASAVVAAPGGDRGPASLYSGGGDSILECESYDSEREIYCISGNGGGLHDPMSACTKLVADNPGAAMMMVGGVGGRTPPPGPPPVLPRDLLPLDSALAPPLARGPPPLLQRPSVPPVVPPPLVGAPSLSPIPSPSQSHPHSRSTSIPQTPLRFSCSGESSVVVTATAAAPPPSLAPLPPPLGPLQMPSSSLCSPQTQQKAGSSSNFPPSQGSPGPQQPPPSSGPLYIVAHQLLGSTSLAAPPHPQGQQHPQHPHSHPHSHPHPFMQAHNPSAVAAAAAALHPAGDSLTLMGLMPPFRAPVLSGAGAASSHSLALQHHQVYQVLPQQSQPQQLSPQQQHQVLPSAHQPLPRRMPSLSLMSVPSSYNGPSTGSSPQTTVTPIGHTSSSVALEASSTMATGGGNPGGGGGGVTRAPSFAGGCGGNGGGGGGAGGKPPRLGGGGGAGSSSFGPSAAALSNPVAALSQHSRFLAVPGTGMGTPGGLTQSAATSAGGGGGGVASPPRLRHSGVSGGLTAAAPNSAVSPSGPAVGGGGCGGGSAATNVPGNGAGVSGGVPTARNRLPSTANTAAGAAGHHSVFLAPLTAAAAASTATTPPLSRQPQQSSPLAHSPAGVPSLPLRGPGGGSSASTVGTLAATAAATAVPCAMAQQKMSGDLVASRGASSTLSGLIEGVGLAVSSSNFGSASQHPQPRRSNGSRTSPRRRNSQAHVLPGAAAVALSPAMAAPPPAPSLTGSQHQQQLGTAGVGSPAAAAGGVGGSGNAVAASAAHSPASAAAGGGGVGSGGGGASTGLNVSGPVSAATMRLPALSLSRNLIVITNNSSNAATNPSSTTAGPA